MSEIKIHYRPDLWHGKYDHCTRIWLHEASCLRDISGGEERIRRIVQRRREWGRRMVKAMGPMGNTPGAKQPGSWSWTRLEITDQDEDNLISMLEFLQKATVEYRKVITGDWMYFYSADAQFIDTIGSLPFLTHPGRTQRSRIKLQGTPGTVVLQEARHQYRSYFRGYMRLTDQQDQALQKYVSSLDGVRLSPALQEWAQNQNYRFIGDYFFIDHDDMGIVTMLSLIVPGIIRRTKPIETAK